MDAPFDLLETLRWTPDEGFFLLERHLGRLHDSAGHFGFRCSRSDVRDRLAAAVSGATHPLRIRLLVARDGGIRIEQYALEPWAECLRVRLASRPIDPGDPFLFHKTTSRAQVERERAAPFDELVLWNPSREITEAITANIVVDRGEGLVTPPVACGLLAGTLRAELLAAGEIAERRISIDDLRAAPRFWLINSVRGWRAAVLVDPA